MHICICVRGNCHYYFFLLSAILEAFTSRQEEISFVLMLQWRKITCGLCQLKYCWRNALNQITGKHRHVVWNILYAMDLVLDMLCKICAAKSSGFCVVNRHNNSKPPLTAAHSQRKKEFDPELSVKRLVVADFYFIDERHAMQRHVIYPCWAILLHPILCHLMHATYPTFNTQYLVGKMCLWLNRQSANWKQAENMSRQLRRLHWNNLNVWSYLMKH